VLCPDYDPNKGSTNRAGVQLNAKMERLERRLCTIESMLWDNRDKYTKSLDIVANREIEINDAIVETRKILAENRKLYSEAFSALFKKEEALEAMLTETKLQLAATQTVLAENRKIYTDALTELRDAEVANGKSLKNIQENTPLFLGPASVLNPLLNHINRRHDCGD